MRCSALAIGLASLASGSCLDTKSPFDGRGRQLEYEEGRVVAVLGSESGPEMIGTRPLHAVRDHEGGYVLVDGRQVVRIGEIGFTGILGGSGQGPGEYRLPALIRTAPDGSVWVFDLVQARMISFATSGEMRGEVSLRHVGQILDAAFFDDGGVAILGTEASSSPAHVLHLRHATSGEWQVVALSADNRSAGVSGPEMRRFVRVMDGTRPLIIDPVRYLFSEVDPSSGEKVVVFDGSGPFWDSLREHDGERERLPLLQDVHLNPDRTAWVLATVPVASEERRRLVDAMSPAERERPDGSEIASQYSQSLLELIDLETGSVLRTIITPQYSTMILDGGPTIGHYPGDLPYPRLELLRFD